MVTIMFRFDYRATEDELKWVRERWMKAVSDHQSNTESEYDPTAATPMPPSSATAHFAIPHGCPHTAPVYQPDPRDRGQPVAPQPGHPIILSL
jgi:hypothetical protein